MVWIYNTGIFLFTCLLRFAALFNPKAKKFVAGRKDIFNTISTNLPANKKRIWFHVASLGEFEQGRPVIEAIREKYPEKVIIITFFSPSGYEIRKNYTGADAVFYLPMDTPKNADLFIELVDPEMAFFVKYEFWHHYFSGLKNRNIPLYVISAIFRKDQVFFKWYGGFYRSTLACVSCFFVQNKESAELLSSIDRAPVIVSGDTRFDRVAQNATKPISLPEVERFCGDKPVAVFGSTWPDDEQLIAALAIENTAWKFIIAPHEVDAPHIEALAKKFPDGVKHSQLAENSFTKQTLIIDNIGMLTALYQYGKIAYIGGGFGKGIHNTLEAAAFGLPVIFGPNYRKFQEAKELLVCGGAISIANEQELKIAFKQLVSDKEAATKIKNYVAAKVGATDRIISYISRKNA